MKSLVTSYFFKASGKPNGELVCYTAGYNTKIRMYRRAIKILRKLGYDVIAFDYSLTILRAGQPKLLIEAVDTIVDEVSKRSKSYQQTICMGISLGGFIGYNVQKRVANAYIGAFADCGVDFVPAIFSSRYFKEIAKSYLKNGYSANDLNRIWRPLDAEPSKSTFPLHKSFIVFDGTRDQIINFQEAKNNIVTWAAKGIRVKQFPLRARGHLLTGVYFIKNTKRVITQAKAHYQATA